MPTGPDRETVHTPALPEPWAWFGVLTVALIPLAVAIPLDFIEKRRLNLTPFDPAIWLAAGVLVLVCLLDDARRSVLREGLRRWGFTVWPAGVLLLAGLVSLAQIESVDGSVLKLALKSAFQWVEYLLVAPFVFGLLLSDPVWRNRAMWGLTLGTGAAILAVMKTPLAQVFAGEIHPHRVGGLLGNRNTYGIFMAVGLCLLAGWSRPVKPKTPAEATVPWWLIPGLLLPFLAVYPMLAAGGLIALLAGLAVTHAWSYRAGGVIVLVLIGWIFIMGGEEERATRFRELARSVQVYRPFRNPRTGQEERRHTMRYTRWAANLNMIRSNPIFGVGWGQYQKHVTRYYGDIVYPEGSTDDVTLFDVETNEPLTFAWYFVLAAETGLVGLVAWFVLFGEVAARAIGRGAQRCLCAGGVMGAVVALLIACLWTSPMVRGAGPLLGLLLAMSGVRHVPDGSEALSREDADRVPDGVIGTEERGEAL